MNVEIHKSHSHESKSGTCVPVRGCKTHADVSSAVDLPLEVHVSKSLNIVYWSSSKHTDLWWSTELACPRITQPNMNCCCLFGAYLIITGIIISRFPAQSYCCTLPKLKNTFTLHEMLRLHVSWSVRLKIFFVKGFYFCFFLPHNNFVWSLPLNYCSSLKIKCSVLHFKTWNIFHFALLKKCVFFPGKPTFCWSCWLTFSNLTLVVASSPICYLLLVVYF